MVCNAVLNIIQLYHGGQCTYPCFPGVSLTITPDNILFKSLAAFPHNHCRSSGQRRERSESGRNDYLGFSERIFAESGFEPATSCFTGRLRYRLSYWAQLHFVLTQYHKTPHFKALKM